MAIEITNNVVFAYDIDMFNNILTNTQGKLLEINKSVFNKIENYYNINLTNYGVECID